MDAKDNILLKVTHDEIYTFFNSEDLEEFILGNKHCQLQVKNSNVEPYHIKFKFDGSWTIQDISQHKTVKVGKKTIADKVIKIKEGDIIGIYPPNSKREKPSITVEVIKKINAHYNHSKMTAINLTNKNEYIIGREESNDIFVDNLQVDKKHCKIVYDGKDCYIEDTHSINGTFLNNRRIKRAKLSNYDRISIASAAYTFYDYKLLTSKSANGIEIEAQNVEKIVPDSKTRQKISLLDNISMKILAGEFVAIVGGSGAGKSTFLDCINGVRPCTGGKILYDENDYYENINSYRGVVGNVPQKDIMHDDLTVEKGLYYTAKIRMRADLTKDDVLRRVKNAIADVKLQGKEKLKISALSGGQKKRVSIAMELLADPKVIFLDEPTSGLSPDLDLEMMELLKELATKGRTIVVITHNMDNLFKCDRVAFLGRGGRLCYYDKSEKMFEYFKLDSYSKIFALLSNEKKSIEYAEKYRIKMADKTAFI